jgi:hypothetical protein
LTLRSNLGVVEPYFSFPFIPIALYQILIDSCLFFCLFLSSAKDHAMPYRLASQSYFDQDGQGQPTFWRELMALGHLFLYARVLTSFFPSLRKQLVLIFKWTSA